MTAKNDGSTDEQVPGVAAKCASCGDEHPIGDRSMGAQNITTVCPHCGDTRYSSIARGNQTIKPDAERINDAVRNVKGVGEQTRENILASFSTYYDFEAASARELRRIDGVGKQTAQRIIDAR